MKKTVILSACLFFAAALVFSQGSETLSLSVEDAVILAADNNVSLKQQKLSLDLLQKQKNSSWNSVIPSLSLSGSYGNTISGTNDAWAEGNQKENDSLTGTASVSLSLSPSLYTTMNGAKLSYEAGVTSYESLIRSIELSVRKSFYKLLYDKENIELQENALESARQTYESNRMKYSQGRISELEMLTSQYNYESKRPTIDSLKNSYEISLDSFKQVLGLKLTDEIELIGSLEEAVVLSLDEEFMSTDVNELPAVKTAAQSVASAKNSLLATRFSAWGPSVTASASATENFTNESLSVSYSLGVRIPLDGYLPWSSGAMSIASQKTNLEKLNLDFENTKTSAIIEIRSSYNTIKQALGQLETYEKNVDLMQRTYQMTQTAYNAGSADFLSLQTASDNLASARNSLQNQRYAIISAVLDLENALGVPFGTLNQEK